MTKYAPRTSTAAVAWAKSKVGQAIYSGMCQAFTVTAFGTGAVGDYDGDRDADAVDGWKAAKTKVPAAQIDDYTDIPAGVALYWSGGSRGYGHAAVSIGGGRMVTTDFAGGRVGIASIEGWWARSHRFLGYVTVEGNGHTLTDPPKPRTIRIGSWNLGLNNPTGLRTWPSRRPRIIKRVRQFRLDVLAVQERPQDPGKDLDGKIIGRDKKPMKKIGQSGRYIYLVSSARDVAWISHLIAGKRVTLAAATIHGTRRVYVCAHSLSGSGDKASSNRTAYYEGVWRRAEAFAAAEDVDRESIIVLGDHNGGEAAVVGKERGWMRARTAAAIKGVLIRTYQAFGKYAKRAPGGQKDYILIHRSKRRTVQRYRVVSTPHASDHNLVVCQIKE